MNAESCNITLQWAARVIFSGSERFTLKLTEASLRVGATEKYFLRLKKSVHKSSNTPKYSTAPTNIFPQMKDPNKASFKKAKYNKGLWSRTPSITASYSALSSNFTILHFSAFDLRRTIMPITFTVICPIVPM